MKPQEFHHREPREKLIYKNSGPSVARWDQETNHLVEDTEGRKE